VALQIKEAKKATYAQTFIAASSLLQDENARSDRGALFTFGKTRRFDQWTQAERDTAQRVVQKLDIVAVMVYEGMLPEKVILENWGDTYRRTWNCARDLIDFARNRAADPTFFFRFEWLAQRAVAAYRPPNPSPGPARLNPVDPASVLPTYALDKMATAEPLRREPPVPRGSPPPEEHPPQNPTARSGETETL
jgi:hypothetical protein